MNEFGYRRAGSVAEATQLVGDSPGAVFLAGGTNLVDHLKLGLSRPELVVDISRLPLDEIRDLGDDGLLVGATVRNSDLAADPVVRSRFPLVTQAILSGASGQLRNVATTAGNLLQGTRCAYFQDLSTPCNRRTPGTGCSARGGQTRYHAILGTTPECIATHSSDMAVAMTALDARVRISGTAGDREIPLAQLYTGSGAPSAREHTLAHGELITGVVLPWGTMAGRPATYRKVRDRRSFAFALVSVALAVDVDDGRIRDVRLALGGVAPHPWRALIAEHTLRGGPASVDAFRAAAAAELEAAVVDEGNAYKVPMVTRTLVHLLEQLTQEAA